MPEFCLFICLPLFLPFTGKISWKSYRARIMGGSLTFRNLQLPWSGRYRQASLWSCLVLSSVSEIAVQSSYSAASPAKTHWHASVSSGSLMYVCWIGKLLLHNVFWKFCVLSTRYIESQTLGYDWSKCLDNMLGCHTVSDRFSLWI